MRVCVVSLIRITAGRAEASPLGARQPGIIGSVASIATFVVQSFLLGYNCPSFRAAHNKFGWGSWKGRFLMHDRGYPVVFASWMVALLVGGSQVGAQVPPPDRQPPSVFAPPGPRDAQGASSFGLAGATGEQVVSVRAGFTAPAADRSAQFFITATIQRGWHIYSITQPPGGPLATKIKLEPSDSCKVMGSFQADPAPSKKAEPAFDNLTVESHFGTVSWSAPIQFAAGVDPGMLKIRGQLNVQPCDAEACLPPRDIEFTAGIERDVVLAKPSANPPQRAVQMPSPANAPPQQPARPSAETTTGYRISWQPFTTIAALGDVLGPRFDVEQVQAYVRQQVTGASSLGVLGYMALGFLGGLILNIMPCVLPVIGLKILSFVEQAGHDRRKALTLNIWYSLGLMSVFFVLATLAVSPQHLGWGQLFGKTWFSITLAAVVFVMGLSFLGVWELPIPGFVGRGKASDLAAQEGALGAFAKGVLTTVLATPCSAPFLASALFWAVAQPPLLTYAVLLSAGLGMASPYLVIGAFPATIRFLPKPGAWMDTFKQVMGFVLLGTVVFILTFVQPQYVVPTVGLLFGLWAACWWIGRISPLAEAGEKNVKWLEATAFAGAIWILMFPGIDKVFPGRYSFGGLVAIMEERLGGPQEDAAVAISRQAQATRTAGPKTVLVDFTANWCLTCKTLEATVLNTQTVVEAINNNGVVTLKADWTYEPAEISKMLEVLGGKQVPVLAIFSSKDPNRPLVLRGGYTQQMVLDALEHAGPSQ